jgi:anti-anti-sigma factor
VDVVVETREITPKTAVVTVTGYVQTKEARILQRKLAEVDDQQVKRVILDFTGVAYASSAALGLLVTYTNRKKEEEGGEAVAIVGLSSNIQNVLNTRGLLPLFLLCDDVSGALEKLGLPAPGDSGGSS